jgi:hypothetical protein
VNEIKERIAKILGDADFQRTGSRSLMPWMASPERDYFIKVADAVLEAMREPTPEMVRCGCGWGMALANDDVVGGWQAMIDAARSRGRNLVSDRKNNTKGV